MPVFPSAHYQAPPHSARARDAPCGGAGRQVADMLDEVACTVDVVADVLDEVVCTVDVVAYCNTSRP